MSYTTDMELDLGKLGYVEAEIQYDGQRAHPGGFDEPPTDAEFWIEAVRVGNLDLFPIIEKDPYLLQKLTADVQEHLASY